MHGGVRMAAASEASRAVGGGVAVTEQRVGPRGPHELHLAGAAGAVTLGCRRLSGHTFVKPVYLSKVYILVQITTDTYVNQQLQLLHFQNVV
jgi:hypothetical protein